MFQISMLIFLTTQTWMEGQMPLPRVLQRRLVHTTSEVRQNALLQLRCRRNPYEYKALRKGLKDERTEVRWRALAGLLLCKDKQAVDAMHQAAQDPSFLIRLAAARGAARIRGRESFLLLRSLLEDRHPTVHAYALVGLVQRGYKLALSMLRRRFRQREQEAIQAALLDAIERTSAFRALPALWGALASEDTKLRRASLRVLVVLSLRRRRVRRAALRWLERQRGRRRGVERAVICAALALLSEPEGVKAYALLLKEGKLREALEAVRFLASMREPLVIGLLQDATKSPLLSVRSEASVAMERIRGDLSRWRSMEERTF